MDKVSYALGLSIGNNFRTQASRIFKEDFVQGIE